MPRPEWLWQEHYGGGGGYRTPVLIHTFQVFSVRILRLCSSASVGPKTGSLTQLAELFRRGRLRRTCPHYPSWLITSAQEGLALDRIPVRD